MACTNCHPPQPDRPPAGQCGPSGYCGKDFCCQCKRAYPVVSRFFVTEVVAESIFSFEKVYDFTFFRLKKCRD
jgi:hypothetical protein